MLIEDLKKGLDTIDSECFAKLPRSRAGTHNLQQCHQRKLHALLGKELGFE